MYSVKCVKTDLIEWICREYSPHIGGVIEIKPDKNKRAVVSREKALKWLKMYRESHLGLEYKFVLVKIKS